MSKRPDHNAKQLQYMSLADYARLPFESTEPNKSSPWEFDEKLLTLNIDEVTSSGVKRQLYYVDLEECATPAEVLDWIMHIQGKVWATDEVLAGLVRALWRCLGPKICFDPARGGRTDVRVIVRKRMSSANGVCDRPMEGERRNRDRTSEQAS